MSSRSRLGLLTIVIVSFAILGIIGWRSLPPPTPPPTTTTVTGSQTAVTPIRPIEWIKISQVKPTNYYVSLLEANDTQPYVQLAKDLRKLPDLDNATAVAKITYLALNASNPEVKEAFELMIKGGTPYPGDFKYSVPDYNTELQVLYWLACQNEFKKDDTLALAIAMVNGLWVTMGTDEVKQTVRNDTSELLGFLRETNEIRKARGYRPLEDYPLEAKIALAWTGNEAIYKGPHSLSGADRGLVGGTFRATIDDYNWDTVSLQTLKEMRKFMDEKDWFKANADEVVRLVESYFFDTRAHWDNPTDPSNLAGLKAERGKNAGTWNADFVWEYVKKNGRGIGVCVDNMAFVDALAKSVGIPTLPFSVIWERDGESGGHAYVVYYDSLQQRWRAHNQHFYRTGGLKAEVYGTYLFKPPRQSGQVSLVETRALKRESSRKWLLHSTKNNLRGYQRQLFERSRNVRNEEVAALQLGDAYGSWKSKYAAFCFPYAGSISAGSSARYKSEFFI